MGCLNKAPSSSTDVILGTRTHMVLFVQPRSSRSSTMYLVDAGGGAFGIVQPIPLRHNYTVQGAAVPEEHRLVQVGERRAESPPASSVADAQRLTTAEVVQRPVNATTPTLEWRLEIRCGAFLPNWRVLFSFFVDPVSMDDIKQANSMATSVGADAGFRENLYCVSYFRLKKWYSEFAPFRSQSGELGRLVLANGKITRRVGDTSTTVTTMKTDAEKIDALASHFSVIVEDERDS